MTNTKLNIKTDKFIKLFSNGINRRDILLRILTTICSEVGVSFGIVTISDSNKEYLSIEAFHGYQIDQLQNFTRFDIRNKNDGASSIAVKAYLEKDSIKSFTTDPNYISFSSDVIENYSIPILENDETVGVLTLERKQSDQTFENVENNKFICSFYSNLILTALNYRKLIISDFQFFLINLLKDSDTSNLNKCAEWLRLNMNFDFCGVYLRSKRDDFYLVGSYNKGIDIFPELKNVVYNINEDLIGWVAGNNSPIRLLNTVDNSSEEFTWYEKHFGNRPVWTGKMKKGPSSNFTAVPLFDGIRVIGVLRLSNFNQNNLNSNSLEFVDEHALMMIGNILATRIIVWERRAALVKIFTEQWFIKKTLRFDNLIEKSLGSITQSTRANDALLILKNELDSVAMYAYWFNKSSEHILIDDPLAQNRLLSILLNNKKVIAMDLIDLNNGTNIYDNYYDKNSRSIVGIPLMTDYKEEGHFEVIGALFAFSDIDHSFYEEDQTILFSIAEKIIDSFIVIDVESKLAKAIAEVNRWKHAALSENLAAGQIHDTRKIIKLTAPIITSLRNSNVISQDKDLNEKVKLLESQMKVLLKRFQGLQKYFTRSESSNTLINFDDLVKETISEMLNIIQLRHAKVNIDDLNSSGNRINIDPVQMKVIIVNLLGNALEAKARRISIKSRIQKTTESNSSFLECLIIDDGVGIPKDQWHLIFDAFYTKGKEKEGSGLGLWVCNEFIEAHGGEIMVEESIQFERTVLKFRIPIK